MFKEIPDSFKKAVLIFGSAFLIYYFFRPKRASDGSIISSGNSGDSAVSFDGEDISKREKAMMPTMTKKTAQANPLAAKAFVPLKAYVAAWNAGEPQKTLDNLNKEMEVEYKMKVTHRKDGKFVVSDISGKDIIIHPVS